VSDVEVPLAGGNVTAGVVRVGDTVRRPAGPQTPAVHALLTHLADVGYRHSPRSLGLDDRGRHVLEHIPGTMADAPRPVGGPLDLAAVGRLIRELHDALDGWVPPDDAVWLAPIPTDGADLVVHNDLAPWNLVLGEGHMVLIDWDACSPGTRGWDLAYAAHGFVPLAPETDLGVASAALRALADGYGLDGNGRERLADLLAPRTWSMHTLLEAGHRSGEQPWARLWAEGHGTVWRSHAEWIEEHDDVLRRALLG
jgi:hypothetical protein